MAKLLTNKLLELFTLMGITPTEASKQFLQTNFIEVMSRICEGLVDRRIGQEAIKRTLSQINKTSSEKLSVSEFEKALEQGFYRSSFTTNLAHIDNKHKASLLQKALDVVEIKATFIVENIQDVIQLIYVEEISRLNDMVATLFDLYYESYDQIKTFLTRAERTIADLESTMQSIRAEIMQKNSLNKNLDTILGCLENEDNMLRNLGNISENLRHLEISEPIVNKIIYIHELLQNELGKLSGKDFNQADNIINDILKPTISDLRSILRIMNYLKVDKIDALPDIQRVYDRINAYVSSFSSSTDLINLAMVILCESIKIDEDHYFSMVEFFATFAELAEENASLPSKNKSVPAPESFFIAQGMALQMELRLLQFIDWKVNPSANDINRLHEMQLKTNATTKQEAKQEAPNAPPQPSPPATPLEPGRRRPSSKYF